MGESTAVLLNLLYHLPAFYATRFYNLLDCLAGLGLMRPDCSGSYSSLGPVVKRLYWELQFDFCTINLQCLQAVFHLVTYAVCN